MIRLREAIMAWILFMPGHEISESRIKVMNLFGLLENKGGDIHTEESNGFSLE